MPGQSDIGDGCTGGIAELRPYSVRIRRIPASLADRTGQSVAFSDAKNIPGRDGIGVVGCLLGMVRRSRIAISRPKPSRRYRPTFRETTVEGECGEHRGKPVAGRRLADPGGRPGYHRRTPQSRSRPVAPTSGSGGPPGTGVCRPPRIGWGVPIPAHERKRRTSPLFPSWRRASQLARPSLHYECRAHSPSRQHDF